MSVRNSTSAAAITAPAAAGVASVLKDVRGDKAAAEAKRKREVEAAKARLQAASDSGAVEAAKARITARYEETKRGQEEEAAAKKKLGKLPPGAYWVRGYYQDRGGKRTWISGYWAGGGLARDGKPLPKTVQTLNFKKAANAPDEQRLALAAVYMPDVQDSQGDFMSAEEIRKTMWDYMARGDNFCVDLNHDGKVTSCQVVESFIVRKGDPDFPIPGTWVVGIYVPDDALWAKVQKGELNGVSMEGLGRAIVRDEAPTPTVDIICKGDTATTDAHNHTFEITLDKSGRIVGGKTSVHKGADGKEHFHEIVKGVVTEEAGGHRHRFNTLGSVKLQKKDMPSGSFYDKYEALMADAAKRGSVADYIRAYVTLHPNMREKAQKRAVDAILAARTFEKHLTSRMSLATPAQRSAYAAAVRTGNYDELVNLIRDIEPSATLSIAQTYANDTINTYRVNASAATIQARIADTQKKLTLARAGDKTALAQALKQMRSMDAPMLQRLGGLMDVPANALAGQAKNTMLDAIYASVSGGAKPSPTVVQRVTTAAERAGKNIAGLLPKRKVIAAKDPSSLKNLSGFKVWWDNDTHFENALKDMHTWSDTQVRRAHNLLTGKFHGGTKAEMISSLRAFRSNQMIAAKVNLLEGKAPLPRSAVRPHAFGERYFVKPHKRFINGKWVDVSGYWADPHDRVGNVKVLEERINVAAKQKLKPAVIAKKPPVPAANKLVKVKPVVRVPKRMARLPGALGWVATGAQFFMKDETTAAGRVLKKMHNAMEAAHAA